ncbi:MAG: tetratricopeptide repeat protein, partial [Bradymonadaceae bacterium]
MNCVYCGYYNDEPTAVCGRCGADLPDPTCEQCGVEVEWGEALCEQCEQLSESADKTACPSCGSLNNVSAEYCTSCGTPMAVITKVTKLARANDREPLETWRVYGIETEMVGRDEEIAALHDALQAVVDGGASRSVAITGRTGLGKSRLLAEFEQQVEEKFGETVFTEASPRTDTSGPFDLFKRLLKNRFYIPENEAPATARRKFQEAVTSVVDDEVRGERIAHVIGESIDLHYEDSPHTSAGDDGDRSNVDRKTLDALVELLRADAQNNPAIVAFEDLQYADSRTARFIEYLTDELSDSPILFLLTWNPEELFFEETLEEIDFDRRLELRGLSDEEVRQFVRQTLRRAKNVPEGFVDRIVDAAHGNPLSVEEMLRILISEGIVDTREREWVIHRDELEDFELPKTVEETVKARLDALTEDERTILEMAAAVGDVFWVELVRCLFHLYADHDEEIRDYWESDELESRVDELLESLERKDMVRRQDESTLPDHDQCRFKHHIERETLDGELASQTKQRYHRLIAQWLEREAGDSIERMADKIAEHYDHAHCLEQAAEKYIEAAGYAASRYANDRAVDLYTKGLGYLSDASMETKVDAFHDLGSVYERRGEHDQALAYFREMLRYAFLMRDFAKGGAAMNKIGRAYRELGEYDEALEFFERALDLFWRETDLRGVASTLDDAGQIHWIRGEYDEALKYYSAGLELRRETADERSIAVSLSNLGSLKLRRGQLGDAMAYYREALDLRRSVDDRQGVADSYNTLGALCMERGEVDDAITLFEEALSLARDIGSRVLEGRVLNNLGEAHLEQERLDEAEDRLQHARDVARSTGNKRVLFDVERNLGEVALERSEPASAAERVQDALELADELDSDTLEGMAKWSLADIHAAWTDGEDGRADRAEALYDEAVDLLEAVGSRAKLGRCLSAYGDFLVDRGDAVRGKQHLEQARELFKELE